MSHIKYHCHWHLPYIMFSRNFWKSFSSFTLSSHLCRHVLSGHGAPTGQCCWKNRRTTSSLFVGLWQWHKLNRTVFLPLAFPNHEKEDDGVDDQEKYFSSLQPYFQTTSHPLAEAKQPPYPTRIGSASFVTTTLMRLWLLLPYTQPRCHFGRQRFGVATSCLPFTKCWYGDRDHLPGLP